MLRKLTKSAGKDTEVHLNESELKPDPIDQFASWYEQTKSIGMIEPDAMTMATCSPDAKKIKLEN